MTRHSFAIPAFLISVVLASPRAGQAQTFRVETFNIVNRDNVANVNAVSGPTFGTAVGYLPGREVQFGIRYLFGQ